MNSLYPNFYQVCRLCLSKLNGSYIPLFEDNKINNENVNYRVKIKFCFSITVEETDNLPNALCNTCMKDVDKFYTFKETVVRNNSFLKAYTCGHVHKNCERACKEKTSRHTQVNIQKTNEKNITDENASSTADNDPIDKFLQSTKDKIKIEMIPQVHDSSFDSSQTIASNFDSSISDNGSISNNNNNSDDNDLTKEDSVVPYYATSSTQLDLSNKMLKKVDIPAGNCFNYSKSDNAQLLSPVRNDNTISSRSRDYSINSSSSLENSRVVVRTHLNCIGGELDSEDTTSAASDTFRDEMEDDPRLIIDEECDVKSEFNGEIDIIESRPDNVILLQTTDSAVNGQHYSSSDGTPDSKRKLSTCSSSPSSIKNEVIVVKPDYSHSRSNSPRQYSSHQGSTRRKQKCPTKSIDGLGEEEEENSHDERCKSPNIQHQIINISPITVTCSSIPHDREEIIGYSQAQFLDEVLSRHSSPATTPPIIPLHAERLHKACDVLLRAASKIQDLPIVMEEVPLYKSPAIKHEERENSRPSLSTRNGKSKDTLQNPPTPQKECSNCHAIQTTIWRRDRFGKIVCNACGLYYKLHNFDRPCRMRRDEIHKRNRKRNPGEKGKRNKRNTNASSVANELMEQENSSKLYSDSCYDNNTISTKQNHSLANGVSKKRRKTNSGVVSKTSATKASIGKDDVCLVFTQSDDGLQQDVSLSSGGESIADTTISSKKPPLNDLYNQDKLKIITGAFQLSTHFMPIELAASVATSAAAAVVTNAAATGDCPLNPPSEADENIASETPLNLAADGH